MTTILAISSGHVVGIIFALGFLAACGITFWSARSIPEKQAEAELKFIQWYGECRRYAYHEGYSGGMVENFSEAAFRDYYIVGMTPSQAVEEYFSKE